MAIPNRTNGATWSVAAVVVTLVLALAGCSGSAGVDGSRAAAGAPTTATTTAATTTAERPDAPAGDRSQVLYQLTGDGSVHDGRLTLVDRDGDATWITDRPDRAAGRIPMADLLAAWRPLGFDRVPPNAFLTTATGTTPVELTAPTWDAVTSTVGFRVSPLGGHQLPSGPPGPVELAIDDAEACSVNDPPQYPGIAVIQLILEDGMFPGMATLPSCAVLYGQIADIFSTNPQPEEPPTAFDWLDSYWTCDSVPFFPVVAGGPVPTPGLWSCSSDIGTAMVGGLPA